MFVAAGGDENTAGAGVDVVGTAPPGVVVVVVVVVPGTTGTGTAEITGTGVNITVGSGGAATATGWVVSASRRYVAT